RILGTRCQLATDEFGALPHASQPMAGVPVLRIRGCSRPWRAVVAHSEGHVVVPPDQPNTHLTCVRVLGHVRQRFLDRPEYGHAGLGGEIARLPLLLEDAPNTRCVLELGE